MRPAATLRAPGGAKSVAQRELLLIDSVSLSTSMQSSLLQAL